jgi:cell division protease FtsH
MEMFVGVGASRVREMFKDARRAAPCIIFIDELDSIGRRRGAGLGGGHDEREQTLNQLLSEMDGFEPSENVVVMAATNRPDILDPALLRPGRFDRRITVDLPTLKARKEILQIHARNKPLAPNVTLDRLAQGTPGFSGADLENILNESALLAARQDKDAIEWEDVEEARDKVLMGLVRDGLALTDDELKLIASHEGGHAVVAAVLPNADPIHKVTIVPRGRAMGVTQQLPEREKYIYPIEYLLDRMAVMMGGRAAEDIIFDTHTSGAENDLKQATKLARKMVLDWGMSERLGHVALGGEREQVFLGEEIAHRRNYSETTAREVDEEIKSILETAYQRATDILKKYRQELDDVANALLSKEEIPGEEVMRLVNSERMMGAGVTG